MSKKIILIVGPSGVGKDTLLKQAKKRLKHIENVHFINRYITRKPDENEKNFYITKTAFNILKQSHYFVSSWSAHENEYGIAKESIREGNNIISISRSHIKAFEKEYDNVFAIHISIPKELLLKRLRLRGRESESEIMLRLKRTYETIEANRLIEFENSKEIMTSSKEFVTLLEKLFNE